MDKALIIRTETGKIIGTPQDIGIDKGVLKRTQEIMPKIDKLDFTKLKMSIQQKKEASEEMPYRMGESVFAIKQRVSTQNVQRT